MKSSTVKSFSKKLACPSSNLLLSFSSHTLRPEISFLVKHHLAACEFCYCEIPLLYFYSAPLKGETRVPEIPINLRLLAESILFGGGSGKMKLVGVKGENDFTTIDGEDDQYCN